MGILEARTLEWVAMPSFRRTSQPRGQFRSPALQTDSLPSKPPGKPKNTGAGSLSLLQQNFPTQESNQGLLHCRQILRQLSYQGSSPEAATTEPTCHNYWSPHAQGSVLLNKRSHHNGQHAHHSPSLLKLEKSLCGNKDPAQPKIINTQISKTSNSKRYMQPHIHCSIIYNSQDTETMKCPLIDDG